jgi:hypothetical protein
MPLTNVLTVQVRPEHQLRYVELIQQLAGRAVEKKERFRWTGHQTLFGTRGPELHFVSEVADYAGLASRGAPVEMFERVLGAKPAADWQRELLACTLATRNAISVDRPELSYPPDRTGAAAHPLAVVTTVRARPGGQEAVEELLRKISEAIPKVDDPARIIAFQSVIGDLRTYWTVRPLRELAELDRQRVPARLLNDAFGAGEGGLIFRTAMEAMESVDRAIVRYRPELSNPE